MQAILLLRNSWWAGKGIEREVEIPLMVLLNLHFQNKGKKMKTILLLILLSVNSYSQEYVTPEELEEGWGFRYLHQLDRFESKPKNEISLFYLTPNEHLLCVLTNIKTSNNARNLVITYDLIKKSIVEYDWKVIANYSNDNKICALYNYELNRTLIYNEQRGEFYICNKESKCENSVNELCYIGNHIYKESEDYFSIIIIEHKVYKVKLNLLNENDCPEFELIKNTTLKNNGPNDFNNIQKYPINSIDFLISPIFTENYNLLTGFQLFKDFDYVNDTHFQISENWEISNVYEYSNNNFLLKEKSLSIGKDGDIYAWVSFRLNKEITDWNIDPRVNEAAREARDASGIYRIDTNGQNAVQLVRSWPYNPGGLQISGDGETIYYAYILPDSTSAIMKMDRYGKNKEIVFKLDPKALSVEKPSLKPNIYPNPANEKITISGIKNGKVEIYNTMGQKLIEKEINGISQIDISKIQTGLCILKIESAGKIIYEKILINK